MISDPVHTFVLPLHKPSNFMLFLTVPAHVLTNAILAEACSMVGAVPSGQSESKTKVVSHRKGYQLIEMP